MPSSPSSCHDRSLSPLGMAEHVCRSSSMRQDLSAGKSLADDVVDDEDDCSLSEDSSCSSESNSGSYSINITSTSSHTSDTGSTDDTSTLVDDEEDRNINANVTDIDVLSQLSLKKPEEEIEQIEILLEDSLLQLGPERHEGIAMNSEGVDADDTTLSSTVESTIYGAQSIGPADSIILGKARNVSDLLPEERPKETSSRVADSTSSKRSLVKSIASITHEPETVPPKPKTIPPKPKIVVEHDVDKTVEPPVPAGAKVSKKPKKNIFKRIVKGIRRKGGNKNSKQVTGNESTKVLVPQRTEDVMLKMKNDIAIPRGRNGSKSKVKVEIISGNIDVGDALPKPLFLSADDPSMDPDLHVTPSLVPVRISRVESSSGELGGDNASQDLSQISSLSGTQDTSVMSSTPKRASPLATMVPLNRNMSMGSASVQDVRKVLKQMETQLRKASGKGQKVSRDKVMRALMTVAGSLHDIDEGREMQLELSDLINKEFGALDENADDNEDDENSENSDDEDEDSDESSASSSSMGDFARKEDEEGIFNIWSSVGKLFNPTVKDHNGVNRVLEDLQFSEIARRQSAANSSAHTTTDDVPKSIPAKWKNNADRKRRVKAEVVPSSLQGASKANKCIGKTELAKAETKEKITVKEELEIFSSSKSASGIEVAPPMTTAVKASNDDEKGKAKAKASPTKIKPLPPPREKTPLRAKYSMKNPSAETEKPKAKPALLRVSSGSSGVSSKSNLSGRMTPSRSWWRRWPSQSKDSADISTEPSLSNSSNKSSPPEDGVASLNAFLDNDEVSISEAIEQTAQQKPQGGSVQPSEVVKETQPSSGTVGLRRTVTATDRLEYQLKLLNLSIDDTELSRSMSGALPARSISTFSSRAPSPPSTVHILFPDETSEV